MKELCASLRRYYPVQVVRVRRKVRKIILQSQRCAPLAVYCFYLFTIVLSCKSVKNLLGEQIRQVSCFSDRIPVNSRLIIAGRIRSERISLKKRPEYLQNAVFPVRGTGCFCCGDDFRSRVGYGITCSCTF